MNVIERLQNHAAANNPSAYYAELSAAGVRYGDLAYGVVTGDTTSGRIANSFLNERAEQLGVDLTEADAREI